ncbi:hypothetical protein PCI56_21085 [Plesiomonas shigelloides subsp. oncorhynchi]|nr:hypothetical protein [Plesiomonas shigelloides]
MGWQRAVNLKLRISNRNYLAEAGVANAELIGKGKLNPEKLGVSALEPKVLQVTFDKPMPFLCRCFHCHRLCPRHRIWCNKALPIRLGRWSVTALSCWKSGRSVSSYS